MVERTEDLSLPDAHVGQLLKALLPEGVVARALDNLLPWLCRTPTITTYRVNLLKTTIGSYKEYLENLLLEKYVDPPKVYGIAEIPEVICISRVFNPPPRILDSYKQIIVDSCCGASVLRGAHLYAPGVMAMESGTKPEEWVQVYSDLAGKCRQGTNTRYDSPRKLFLGNGIAHMQRHQLFNIEANGVAVEMMAVVSGVPPLGDLSCSHALLQNLPSIVCVRVLNPQPGEVILDMCAAPGNKTTHIAELMRDEGVIIALDKPARVHLIEKKIKLYDLKSIRIFAFDATKASGEYSGRPAGKMFTPPFADNTFDRILLDAPCSALGNRPLLSSKLSPNMLESFTVVQRKLFSNAVRLLKPQGILVYSTCTITETENESMVAWALQKYPTLELINCTPRLGGCGLKGVGLDNAKRRLVQRFGPPSYNITKDIDTAGFFIAKFLKKF